MNQEQFADLFRQHLPALSKYLTRRVDRNDVEDLAADTLEIAWRKRNSAPAGMELAWLYRIAGFVVANYRRKAKTHGQSFLLRESDIAAPSAEDLAIADLHLAHAFGQLSPGDRQLLSLLVFDGLSVAQVAVALKLNPNTASQRIKRARERLANHLQ